MSISYFMEAVVSGWCGFLDIYKVEIRNGPVPRSPFYCSCHCPASFSKRECLLKYCQLSKDSCLINTESVNWQSEALLVLLSFACQGLSSALRFFFQLLVLMAHLTAWNQQLLADLGDFSSPRDGGIWQ